MEDPTAKLERVYIEEYLKTKGHTWESVHALPEVERRRFLTEASTYASVKLAEVEGKARVIDELHGTHSPSTD
jgi:hypothetical protein